MRKILINYGGAIFLYLVIFFGVILVCTRFEKLNNVIEEEHGIALNY